MQHDTSTLVALAVALAAVSLGTFGTPLVAQEVAATIGAPPIFGRIADAKIMSADRVVVVDEQDQRIWYLDGRGRTVATAGRRGAGPGEFLLTERLVRMDDSTLGVVDRRNARLTMVRVRRDTILTTGSVRITPFVEDACRLGNTMYLAFPDVATGDMVTTAGIDGTITGHLGRIDAGVGPPLLREAYLRAAIGCLPGRNLVVAASHFFPTVRAFDLAGRQLWTAELPAFRQIKIEATEKGGRRFTYRPDGNSGTERVFPVAGDTLAVVTQIAWPGAAGDTATIIGVRYLLDASTGRVLGHTEGPERLLDVWGATEVVMVEDPEPAVILRRR